jgi:carboxymethylenebutenolidase
MRTRIALLLVLTTAACSTRVAPSASRSATPPPGATEATARLGASPRHGEWAMVPAGPGDSVRAWVVYPERRDRAPVVLVVHEIFGVTGWVRSVADQLAADGYIAIAPDMLTGKNVPTGPDGDPVRDSATAAIRTLAPADVQRRLDHVARYGMALPAALPKYGIVGFCWGGSTAFAHAAHAPGLGAAVVYYGASPDSAALRTVRAPVLGLYGENDARVNATIPRADSTLRALGRTYQHEIFAGAGHGFLRAQDGQNGANLAASQAAWPRTLAWFRTHLGR